jgi:thermitase
MKKMMLPIAISCLSVLAATIPNDPYFKYQWPLYNDGTFTTPYYPTVKAGADMKTTLAWNIEQGDSNIVVAIIDGGCKMDHPEFAGRFWVNQDEIPGNGIDDDNNGFIDDVNGWNFLDSNNNLDDQDGHGTAMAGIIGANANNGIGYAGVDWHCRLMILKVANATSTIPSSRVAKAVNYSMANGARVVNISIGSLLEGTKESQAVRQAVIAGVVVVSCAGNEQADSLNFPARIPEVIAVGSSNPDDTWSREFPQGTGGSNYGENLDVVAPGNCIREINPMNENEYVSISSGTSNSTAFVSGLAALLLAQDPRRTPAQITRLICLSSDDQVGKPTEDTPGWDQYHGWGRINMYRALRADTLTVINRRIALTRLCAFNRPQLTFERGSVTIMETRSIAGNKQVVRRTDLLGRVKAIILSQKPLR